MSSLDCDILVVGAGHNGLVCAFYLASAGHRVKVIERRHIVGGAAVTEEFHPGFRNSTASYTVSLLNPKIIADMDLHGHGLRIVERRASNFIPQPDGRYLLTGPGRTKAELAKFSARDAERYDAYASEIDAIADVLRALVLKAPPNVTDSGWLQALPEMLKALSIGAGLRQLSLPLQRALLDLFTKSAADYLDRFFENDSVRAVFGFDATVGSFTSPMTPGTAYVLLHHCFGEVNGKKGAWGHALGGMGAITAAMRKACEAKGVTFELEAPVTEILVERRRAAGVKLEDGRIFHAASVVSNLNPRLLFGSLMPRDALPEDFRDRMSHWKCGSGTFRMNLALSELPNFTALPGKTAGDHHTAGIVIAPTLTYMDRAYRDACDFGWSRKPIVEILIPSTLDDSLAPSRAHVASLFCQHVAPELPDGSSWDKHRDKVADLMIKTVDEYAPGFAMSIIARQIHSPLDLERKFGLIGGDIFHGALTLDQLFSARPMLGHADYRSPLQGLYMCGSGTHPGGGVTGAPGHNAAAVILRDIGRKH
jgi:phytoene dehydrogenase-like protein